MDCKQHVITIPAREVVAGMILRDWGPPHPQVMSVQSRDGDPRSLLWVTEHGGRRWDIGRPAAYLTRVTLPGPSPRELLCECEALWHADPMRGPSAIEPTAHPVWHHPDCPVRRLRLRVWPAPWRGVPFDRFDRGDGDYEPGYWAGDARFVPLSELERGFVGHDLETEHRACFCLPAAHSEQADDAGWTPTAVTGQF